MSHVTYHFWITGSLKFSWVSCWLYIYICIWPLTLHSSLQWQQPRALTSAARWIVHKLTGIACRPLAINGISAVPVSCFTSFANARQLRWGNRSTTLLSLQHLDVTLQSNHLMLAMHFCRKLRCTPMDLFLDDHTDFLERAGLQDQGGSIPGKYRWDSIPTHRQPGKLWVGWDLWENGCYRCWRLALLAVTFSGDALRNLKGKI